MRYAAFRILQDFYVRDTLSLSSLGEKCCSYRVSVIQSIIFNLYIERENLNVPCYLNFRSYFDEKQNKIFENKNSYEKVYNLAAKKFIFDIFPIMVIFYTYLEKGNHLTNKHKQIICETIKKLHTTYFNDKNSVSAAKTYIENLLWHNRKKWLKDFIFSFYDYLKELNFGNGKINYDKIDKQFSEIKKEIDDSYQFTSLPPTIQRPNKIISEDDLGDLIQEKEAIRLSGLSRSSLRRLIKLGKLNYIDRQGYEKESLNNFLLSKQKIKLSESAIASGTSDKDMGKLLTAQEAAKILFPKSSKEVAMRHLNRLKAQNKISYYQLGKKKFYFFEQEIKSINYLY